jgi:ATP-dependent Clp protease adaptor protein ClpS
MSRMGTQTHEETLVDKILDDLIKPDKAIVLYNDDVNDFIHVTKCLVKYCGHDPHQAEQCAHIVHNTGKYAVKHGSYEYLKPICEALLENHLTAKIED